MGAQGAVNILHRKEISEATERGDADAVRASLIEQYEDTLLNPYLAAERGYVDAVIEPSSTRVQVMRALRVLRTKRANRPPKKHGNIPL
jgi:propionyl-CoA carboxylase beta chain